MNILYKLITSVGSLALLLMVVSCNAPKTEQLNDLQEEGLLGKVKKIEVFSHDIEKLPQDTLEGKHNGYTFTSYNEAGYKIEELLEACETDHLSYHYNEVGLLSQEVSSSTYDKKEIGKNLYSYNPKGLRSEEKYYLQGELQHTFRFEYDKDNRLSKMKYYDAQDSLYTIYISEYNPKGQVAKKYYQTPEGDAIWGIIHYRYNDKGLIVEEESLDNDGKVESRYRYTYDERGNRIGIDFQGNTELPNAYKKSLKYDEHNNLIEEITLTDGEEDYLRWEYEYDSVGNWTKCLQYHKVAEGERLNFFVRRHIQYYP